MVEVGAFRGVLTEVLDLLVTATVGALEFDQEEGHHVNCFGEELVAALGVTVVVPGEMATGGVGSKGQPADSVAVAGVGSKQFVGVVHPDPYLQ